MVHNHRFNHKWLALGKCFFLSFLTKTNHRTKVFCTNKPLLLSFYKTKMCQYRHSSFNKWYIWEWGQNSWRVPWNIISGGKTALVLGSPSADLRDDQRVFMKVRLRWSLLQRACAIFGQHDQRRVAVVCSALHGATAATARLHARQGNRNLQTMVQLFTCLIYGVSAQSVPSQRRCLASWPAAKQSQTGRWSWRLGRRSGVAVKHRWEKCILVWLKQ